MHGFDDGLPLDLEAHLPDRFDLVLDSGFRHVTAVVPGAVRQHVFDVTADVLLGGHRVHVGRRREALAVFLFEVRVEPCLSELTNELPGETLATLRQATDLVLLARIGLLPVIESDGEGRESGEHRAETCDRGDFHRESSPIGPEIRRCTGTSTIG